MEWPLGCKNEQKQTWKCFIGNSTEVLRSRLDLNVKWEWELRLFPYLPTTPAQSLLPPGSWKKQPPGTQLWLGTDSEEGPCTLTFMETWCVCDNFLGRFHQGVYFPRAMPLPLWCMRVCWVTQSCPTLCDPMGCSPPGSLVHGNPQARILEWVAISFSRGSSWPRDWTQSPTSPALAGWFLPTEAPGKPTSLMAKVIYKPSQVNQIIYWLIDYIHTHIFVYIYINGWALSIYYIYIDYILKIPEDISPHLCCTFSTYA